MKRMGAAAAVALSACMLAGGCGASAEKTSIYYLNFKPEVASVWRDLAKDYEEETGVEVKVLTVANGNYEQRLKAELAKKDAPTLFHITGPIGYEHWKHYCMDLSNTELYTWQLDENIAVKSGDGVYGIPYVVEGYGIIYNDAVMQKYFALPSKAVSVNSMDEVNNFETFKAVVEDMTLHKSELGIEGVFASTSFGSGEDWRWQTHLANIPVYYEFQDKNVSDTDTLDFKYAQNYKNIFDLYINNSCAQPSELASKTVKDSMADFALERAAMVQNGNWAWSQIAEVEGNKVSEENVKYMPIYTGIEGEEGQGLCIGTGNYLSINATATEEEQQAAVEFMKWVYSSDTGKDYVTNRMGFIAPFETFSEAERPENPLAKEVSKDMENEATQSVNWIFSTFPSQKFKDAFGASLLRYVKGECEWDDVVEGVKEEWALEKAEQ